MSDNCPIKFCKFNNPSKIIPIDNSLLFENEIFIDVTSKIVPEVYGYYQISNYGRVYHKYMGIMLKPGINGGGYYFVSMSTFCGEKMVQIHRLVMLAFSYIDGCEYLEVNHKDGNKLNDIIWNLEWTTHSENVIHAYNLGLQKRGELHFNSTLTDETVKRICVLLQENKYTNKEIVQIVGNGTSETKVESIKKKESWAHISEGFNFYQRPQKIFTEEMVRNICIYFQNNPRKNLSIIKHSKNALEFYGYDERFADSARKIYTKKYYTQISSSYVFY